MADLIQGTITEADRVIVVEIADHIVSHNISGEDFLDLTETYLRRWVHLLPMKITTHLF